MFHLRVCGQFCRLLATRSCAVARPLKRWKSSSKYYSSTDLIPTAAKFTRCGAVMARPKQTKFGMIKVLLTVIPVMLLGATISNKGAELLEDSEIFIPED